MFGDFQSPPSPVPQQPVQIADTPDTLETIITGPVHAIIPKRKYFGQLTKKAAFCRQRGEKIAKNGQKMEAKAQFNLDFPEECREHGFMVSCRGQTLFCNVYLKDFAAALHPQP